MTTSQFRKLALSFPETEEAPHFDRTAFKVIKKRIFTTMHEQSGTVNVNMTQEDQSVFCFYNEKIIYPVPNKWGLKGWTTFELKRVPPALMRDALDLAYKEVIKPKPKRKAR